MKYEIGDIDHINRNPVDNRRSNLRVVSHIINCHNKSGQHGICKTACGKKWRARLMYNHKEYSVHCATKEEAALKRKMLENQFGVSNQESKSL